MKKTLMSGAICLLMCVGAVAISGCSSPQHKAFYSLSGKYTPENTLDFERSEILAKGSNHRPLIFFIPFGSTSPAVALDDAIRSCHRPAVALENIKIYHDSSFMFGVHGYVVHATAILGPSGKHE